VPLNFVKSALTKAGTTTAPVTPVYPRTAGFHSAALGLRTKAGNDLVVDTSLPLWLADGVAYQLPQSWIVGFTDLPNATRYMIRTFGYAYYTQLWSGYWECFNTPEFKLADVFTVVTRINNKPTMFAWFSRFALPYASYIMKANFGFQSGSKAGPILPASGLSQVTVDSSLGFTSVALQYVQLVPDTSVESGTPGWVFNV
jgi:hypothetical protein